MSNDIQEFQKKLKKDKNLTKLRKVKLEKLQEVLPTGYWPGWTA